MAAYCPSCGEQAESGDRFCAACGKPLRDAAALGAADGVQDRPTPSSFDSPGAQSHPSAATSIGGPPLIPPPEPLEGDLAELRSPKGGPWLLIAQQSNGEMRRVAVDGEIRMGRSPACEVLLRDPQVSRVHASLAVAAEGIWLTDHNSTNGTEVNGKRITGSAILHDGDAITVGATRFKILAPMKNDPMDPGATVVAGALPAEPAVPNPPPPPRPVSRYVTCSYCRSTNPAAYQVCSRCGRKL